LTHHHQCLMGPGARPKRLKAEPYRDRARRRTVETERRPRRPAATA
jgi:hypothetical protein